MKKIVRKKIDYRVTAARSWIDANAVGLTQCPRAWETESFDEKYQMSHLKNSLPYRACTLTTQNYRIVNITVKWYFSEKI